MRQLIVLFILLCTQSWAADSLKTRNYTATRIATPPTIDGKLNDDVWKSIAPITDFTQSRPIEGATPSQNTEVKIAYDNTSLYIYAMMYDTSPDSIAHEMGSRDGELNADKFRIVIDTYNKRQDAYDFAVTASGVQQDSRFSDFTYDAIWKSAVQLLPNGWSCEMQIPFFAIRFPKAEEQAWAFQITRWINRHREFIQWNLTPSAGGNSQMFWGLLQGLKNIEPPLRLSLTPYVSTYVQQAPAYNNDGSYQYSNSFIYRAGADIKYGIDERFTVDMTLLPDFGQVQSDQKVKNLSYNEVVYTENRPFFREGTELFSKGGLFYSRRIGRTPALFYSVPYMINPGDKIISNPSQAQLINAAKVSGRTDDGLGIGILNAITAKAEAIIEDSAGNKRSIVTEPLTNYNIVVFDKQYKNNSNFYLINTSVIRNDAAYRDANVSSLGFTLGNKKNTYAVDGSATLSQLLYRLDSLNNFRNTLGYKYFIGVRKTSGNVQFGIRHDLVNNTYNHNDFAVFQINNWRGIGADIGYNQFQPWKKIRNSSHNISFGYSDNFLTHKRTNLNINWNSNVTMLNFWSYFAGGGSSPISSLDYNEPRVPGMIYKTPEFYYLYAGFSSDGRKKFATNVNLNYANFTKNNVHDYWSIPGYGISLDNRYRISDRLSITYGFKYDFDPYNPGFAAFRQTTGEPIIGARRLDTYVNTIGGKYTFKTDMTLTLNARHYWNTGVYRHYFSILPDGSVQKIDNYEDNHSFNYNTVNIDLVYSWIFAPGSIFSIVYKDNLERDEQHIVTLPRFDTNFNRAIVSPQTNSLSLRLLFFLDYNTVKNTLRLRSGRHTSPN